MTGKHPNHDGGEMTEHEKAKNTFALHQDNLFWSRLPLVVTIQGATLVGIYATQADIEIAGGLALLGLVFTLMVLATMRRDDALGEAAMTESHIPKTILPGPWWLPKWCQTKFKGRIEKFALWVRKGKSIAYLAIWLLLIVDVALPIRLHYRAPVDPKPIPVFVVPSPIPPASD